MDLQPTPAELDAADATRRREDSQVLRELIHVSAGLTRLLGQQVAEQLAAVSRGESEAGALPDLVIRYDRLSRSIHRNLLMAKKLAEPIAPPRRPVSAADPSPPAAANRRTAADPPNPMRPTHQPPFPPAHDPIAGLRRDAAPSAGVLAYPPKMADLETRLARDIAARAAAALPLPPNQAGFRPLRTGTGPP